MLVGSWIAGVGAELDHGRLPTLYLRRAGRLSTPTGVGIKRGAKSPVGFGAGGRVGSDSRSSWERDGSLDPYSRGAGDHSGPPVVTHLPATPWCHPDPSVTGGLESVPGIVTSRDAVRAGNVSRSMNVSHGPNLVSSFVRLWATSDDV